MEFSYLVTDGDLRIITPGVHDLADVKNETIKRASDMLVRKSTYPNGFEIIFEQHSGMIIIHCNQPLTRNADGSFTAPTDK